MGLWAKSIVIFNSLREHGKQSIRSLADRTGLSKSSVHRHLQAIDRRDRYPESSNWLRVLDTAERSQVDQCVRHQLHAIVPLLDAFKTEQQPLEFVLPRKSPLDPHA